MNAGTTVAPVIVAGNDALKRDFPLKPFGIRHLLSGHPLLSLPRFGVVVFPFFLALAWRGGRHTRNKTAIIGTSAVLLGVFVTQWVLWYWVA